MAASVITRASLVDNVTLWSAATVNSAVYDAIDSMFGGGGSYTTFEFGGAVKITGALTPVSNNTPALGSTSLMWADLFLGDGGVINFNNGDVTVTHSTNTLTFAGASSGYIFNGGNVGIGVAPLTPDDIYFDALELGKAGCGITANTSSLTGSEQTWILNNAYATYSGGVVWKYGNTGPAAQIGLEDDSLILRNAASGSAGGTITWTDRLRVTSGGNLAIGATARLYLDGVAGTGDTYIYEESGNQITFVTGGTGRLYIDTATVGPRSDNNISSGSNVLRWSVVYAANGTIQTSDRTLKRDISADTLGLDFVQRLRPVSFTMNDEADGARRHGLIAQEVIDAADGQSLLGILTGEKDGEYGLNYAGFVPALIAAIQQQQTEINALKARIH